MAERAKGGGKRAKYVDPCGYYNEVNRKGTITGSCSECGLWTKTMAGSNPQREAGKEWIDTRARCITEKARRDVEEQRKNSSRTRNESLQ